MMEYRLTYVPTKFTHTQVGVRAFFTFFSLCLVLAYACGICFSGRPSEPGQWWMLTLLLLLVALNDPLYITRVLMGGNHTMYSISILGQVCAHSARARRHRAAQHRHPSPQPCGDPPNPAVILPTLR